jgi:hypothetical protein
MHEAPSHQVSHERTGSVVEIEQQKATAKRVKKALGVALVTIDGQRCHQCVCN